MIEIVTQEEADMRAECRKPLWPPHNSCNKNCQQGRACDCLAAVEEPPHKEAAFGAVEGLCSRWGAVSAVASLIVIYALAMLTWPWLSAAARWLKTPF